jgi:RimJ/RimL family protein N-acetyltransferase
LAAHVSGHGDDEEIAGDPLLIDVPEQLEGPRVVLRPFRAGDGAAVWPAVEESRQEVALWQDWIESHRSPRHSELAVRRLRLKFIARECLYFGIWLRLDQHFLGWVGVEDIDWRAPSFQVGCWLRSSAARQGLMTEALALLCRLCFEGLDAKRVALIAEAGNARSIALARRLGFVPEGELRNAGLDVAGTPRTMLVFALTPSDYQARIDLFEQCTRMPEGGKDA